MNKESTEMLISFKAETVKTAWSEALSIFKFRNLGLLLLVSLRALRDAYKALLHAWFLPTALLAGLVLDIKGLVCAFYITLIMRAARPSVDLKKAHYWRQFNVVDWILFIGLLIIVEAIPRLILGSTGSVLLYVYRLLLKAFFLGNNFAWVPGNSILGIVTYFLSPFVILCGLFLLDSKPTVLNYISALGRAFLMMVYNYPFFLISYICVRLIISLSFMISHFFIHSYYYLPHIGWALLFGFLIPFYICFLLSFYVKKVHEQFGLYYRS